MQDIVRRMCPTQAIFLDCHRVRIFTVSGFPFTLKNCSYRRSPNVLVCTRECNCFNRWNEGIRKRSAVKHQYNKPMHTVMSEPLNVLISLHKDS